MTTRREFLVVSFILVDHPESANGDAIDKQISMLNSAIRQNADVQGIAIAIQMPSRSL